ncbi:BrnT family toxin [Alkalimonas cellulosilytica]|uniref:BrnT family toxin n=1 Tax=Alkalimonas cellulosilytica TaxID=3058395 RepID=UPI002E7BBDD2|nr:BrnT family toxin [Alkalimonas sp. MEB108]
MQERQMSFDDAVHLDWATAGIWQDSRKAYPEVRYIAVARLHVLCFTETEGGIRVISFRKANQRWAINCMRKALFGFNGRN